MIVKPENQDFSGKNITIILSGTPGVGKSTLALSAPHVLLIDADNGLCRVRAEHRKDACVCSTYEELLNDIMAARGTYESIVIDTGGALVELMKQHVLSHPADFPGGAKKAGGLSLQGFGMVKSIFLDFSAMVRKDFNVIYVFHEQKTKGDECAEYEIVCDGSAKTLVYQPADLAAHVCIMNGRRMCCFTPTESYFAKGAYGVEGFREVPDLKDGMPNDFLTKLFEEVRMHLKAESEALAPQIAQYNDAMAEGKKLLSEMQKIDDITETVRTLKALPHVLTAQTELTELFKARCSELGFVWDAKARAWTTKA